MEGLPSHKLMFLLIDLHHVSAQMDHHQVILEEYTNVETVSGNYSVSIKFLLVKIG
jgi:hypothetical protein